MLPTYDVLHHRNISTSFVCSTCSTDDNWSHALLDSMMARSVWSLATEEMVEHMVANEETDAKKWLFLTLSNENFTEMVVKLWAIWRLRRNVIHKDIHQSPLSTHYFIKSYLADLDVLAKPSTGRSRNTSSRPSRWIAPPADHAKFNTDATVRRDCSHGVVAVVCRSPAGVFLGASCISFRNLSDPETLEAMGVREALALAEDLYEKKIHVASDCKTIVEGFKHGSSVEYGEIIHEIIKHSTVLRLVV